MIKPRREHEAVLFELDRLSDGSVLLVVRTNAEADHSFRLSAEQFARLADDVAFLQRSQTPPTEQR